MKLEIKYSKSLNEIVALVDGHVQSLKTGQPINKPNDLIKVLPFMKHECSSQWIEMPYGEETEFQEEYLSSTHTSRPYHLLDITPTIGIAYTRNEVNEKFFKLSACLPKYVLNGLASIIDTESIKQQKCSELEDFVLEHREEYIQYGNQVFSGVHEFSDYIRENNIDVKRSEIHSVLCPENIPHVRVRVRNHTFCIPCTNDNVSLIVSKLIDFSRYVKEVQLEYFNIWKVEELEEGIYHLASYYFTSEKEAKTKSVDIWSSYISRDVRTKVTKL